MNRTLFISRHIGAREWAGQQNLSVDEFHTHLDIDYVNKGDRIIGNLPIHIAAQICRRGGRYFHLALNVPVSARGKELSVTELVTYGARIEEYFVSAVFTADPNRGQTN